MKKFWSDNPGFANDALLTCVTLAGLAALVWAAPSLGASPQGRFPATLIGLMRSRIVTYNPGVNGYYEQLLNGDNALAPMNDKTFHILAGLVHDRLYERNFRVYRFRPNLRNFVDRSQPQGLTTNSFGLLGPECTLAPPANVRRIALFGDSMTQGWGTDQRLSWSRVLENRVNSGTNSKQRFEFLNFAVTGYELTQTFDTALQDAPRFHPDVYLLALTELAVGPTWDEHLVWVVQWGIDPKYDFIRDAFRKSGVSSTDEPLVILGKLAPYRRTILQNMLAEMKSQAARKNVPLVVALVPSLEDGRMSENRMDEVPGMLAALQIPMVDLRDTFDRFLDKDSLRINLFDVHPNARGHQMIADNLYTKIRNRPDVWADLAGD